MTQLLLNACGLVVQLSLPLLGGALLAALVMGILQAATQLSDEVFAFVAKLVGTGVVLYLLAASLWSQIAQFTERLWGGADFYR